MVCLYSLLSGIILRQIMSMQGIFLGAATVPCQAVACLSCRLHKVCKTCAESLHAAGVCAPQ